MAIKKIIELKNATIQADNSLDEVKTIPDDVNLTICEHDFLTILGGDGVGKSALFDVITRTLMLTSGSIYILGKDVTHLPAEERANYLARVFQGPKMGTAPRITMAGDFLIAKYRGEERGLLSRKIHAFTDEFQALVARTDNGLGKHLETPTGLLSSRQRQALSLLAATLKRSELLLLDEHMAALDPKTGVSLMNLTDEFMTSDHLTALMIIYHMEDTLKYDNRLIVMKDDKIIKDLGQGEKAQVAITDYYQLFE